jgi:FkbM family methyltransferase
VSALSERAARVSRLLRGASGARGKIAAAKVLASRRGSGGQASPVAVPLKGLGGDVIYVRPGTSDLDNAVDYLSLDIHLPPPEIAAQDLRRVAEIGTNMGAALTGLARAYPSAELLGVEPDPGNLAVAELNVARFGARVKLTRAGIWDEDCRLVVEEAGAHEHGLVVRPATEDEADSEGLVEARTIDSVLGERWPDDGPVDYLHVSIEGSEPRVFAGGGSWPSRVRSLRVEIHPYFGYGADECIGQLEALGYRAWVAPSPPDKWVFAIKR